MESVGVHGRARRLRHMAGAAQHASQALSTLSERSARSHTRSGASECHTSAPSPLPSVSGAHSWWCCWCCCGMQLRTAAAAVLAVGGGTAEREV